MIIGKGSHSGARGGVIGPMIKKMLNEHKVGWDSEGGKGGDQVGVTGRRGEGIVLRRGGQKVKLD